MREMLKNDPIKKRLLDFSDCTNMEEVHRAIQKELELPSWYGCNLDALWDSIVGIMYTPADITIRYRPQRGGYGSIRNYIDKVVEVFEEAKEEEDEIVLTLDIEKQSK